jgi:hypothetical protein
VTFGDGSWTADVDVVIKSYQAPYYVVNEHTERQTWKFSLSDGWRLAAIGKPPPEEPDKDDDAAPERG